MYRNENVPSLERLARLEDRLRDLEPSSRWSTRKKSAAVLAGLGLTAIGVAVALYVLGGVAEQTVMPSSTGHLVTWTGADGKAYTPWLLPSDAHAFSGGRPEIGEPEAPASYGSTLIIPDEALAPTGKTTFVLHYRAFGIPRSAVVAFETSRTDVRFVRSLLEGFPSWVAFSKDREPLLYFTTILTYKFAIESIVWGTNEGPLDRSVHFSSSKSPGIDRDDEVYVKLPAETSAVRVRVRFKDGTETAIRTFQRSTSTLR
jgi:hypothetical protein